MDVFIAKCSEHLLNKQGKFQMSNFQFYFSLDFSVIKALKLKLLLVSGRPVVYS